MDLFARGSEILEEFSIRLAVSNVSNLTENLVRR